MSMLISLLIGLAHGSFNIGDAVNRSRKPQIQNYKSNEFKSVISIENLLEMQKFIETEARKLKSAANEAEKNGNTSEAAVLNAESKRKQEKAKCLEKIYKNMKEECDA